MTVGKHDHLTYRKETMNLSSLLNNQISSQDIDERVRKLVTDMSGMLKCSPKWLILLVSANQQVQNKLQNLVQSRLNSNTKLLELKHQPAEDFRFWESLWKRKTVVDD